MAANKPQITRALIRQAIEETGGVVTEMARRLGVNRSTIHRRLVADPELAAFHSEAREVFLDEAEAGLLKLIRDGNVTAIIFALKTQGRGRGWVERSTEPLPEATPQGVVILLPDNGRGPTRPDANQQGQV